MSFWIVFAVFLSLCLFGAVVFIMSAGVILYLTSLTNDHAHLDTKSVSQAEHTTVMKAHTRDPRVMEPLNAAKERWYARVDSGEVEPITVHSFDGLLLSGWLWKVPDAANCAVIVHGMQDSGAGMGYQAEEYHGNGWNVLVIDQRAHGESEGTKRTMGVREADDIGAWLLDLEKRLPGSRVFLHGVSMGAATVLLYGGKSKSISPLVKGIIADSSYAAYAPVFLRLIRMIFPNRAMSFALLAGADLASLVLSGIGFSRMAPKNALKSIPVPVILFHGQKDVLVPIGMARSFFAAADSLAFEVVVIPDAPHIGAYFYAPELYMKKIIDLSGRV